MNKDILQPLKGFRDFSGASALARQEVLGQIRAVFMKYGFLPMETPTLEYKEILTGKYGEEGDKLLYSFKDLGGRAVAMRYDLTVPLARFYAQYQNELPMPFKRYQIAPVWRADRPQKGRYREFTQCDIDVVGASSIAADAEVIASLNEAVKSLGIRDIIIRLNNRKFLDAVLASAGIADKKKLAAIRALDKLDKIGQAGVREELALAGIKTGQREALFKFLNTTFDNSEDMLLEFKDYAGAGDLAELMDILLNMKVPNYQVDLSLARGLEYYTGTIFEIILPDARAFGSVAGGGRYDNLIGSFVGKSVPAVGGSIGIDRLLAALEEMELIKYDLVSDALVCNLEEAYLEKYLKIVQELRTEGIKTDFYFESSKLGKQLKYANKKNINFAVILGPDEMKGKSVAVKDLATGKQKIVKQNSLVKYLKKQTEK